MSAFLKAEGFLSEVDAAKLLNVSVRTLQSWRSQNSGPAWAPLGRKKFYSRAAIIAYMKDQEQRTLSKCQRRRRAA